MKIHELYITGYKNIHETRIKFLAPITLIVSGNNFGKTILLNGIKKGFSFLRDGSANAADYINQKDYLNKFGASDKFTFEITFSECKPNDETVYCYRYAIDRMDNSEQWGITEELLKKIDNVNGKEVILLERNCDKPLTSHLHSYVKDSEEVFYLSEGSSELFIRAFCESPRTDGDAFWVDYKETLNEVRNAFRSLTKYSVGDILIDEDTDCKGFTLVAKELNDMKINDNDNFIYFVTSFTSLFPRYTKLDVRFEQPERPYLEFERDDSETPETIDTLSYGTRRILKLLFSIMVHKEPLVSIEDLETGIHPMLFVNVVNKVSEMLTKKYDGHNSPRLIVTTHSTSFINMFARYNNFVQQLDSVYIGLDGYLRDNDDSGVKSRFVKIRDDKKEVLSERIDELDGMFGFGDIMYGYGEDEELAKELRSWFEK